MASSGLTILTLFLFYTAIGSSSGLEVRIEPNVPEIRKDVGEDLILSCSVKKSKEEQDRFSLSWQVPLDKNVRVNINDISGRLILSVKDLHETDRGNYKCTLVSEHDPPVRTSVNVVVLPRGRVGYCSHDSFRCLNGECISSRYKCDGHPDCTDASDERQADQCGTDVCAGKLICEEGRCIPPSLCCREKDMHPPNCTIRPSIECCKQLLHPAIRDQDLYYLKAPPRLHQQRNPQPDSTLIMGCIVAVANLVTVGIIVGVRYHLWRSNGSTSRAHYHLNRLRSATLRPFGFGTSLNPPSTTDQYQLRSADTLYSRRIPGLRSDLLSPEILREQRQCTHQQRPYTGGVVLCPPTNAQPPQYSQLPSAHTGPPPAYHQVVGAPPPPYSSRDDLTLGSSSDGSSLSLLSPLLNNNNNGDINGNTTAHLSVIQNQNVAHATASSAAPSQFSGSQTRGNK
ncbi:uncharacterized protein LOC122261596 [Penaeus japonicus]|uniref:uncharacterized protein LOC122261596 n=1 Tax=Penaeus japonicus TaxID=27405 RepID=UPI001C714266|nr:uncharacterized protein LOC122261596 [Penaeus japonicus]